jgi:hypothetical protein
MSFPEAFPEGGPGHRRTAWVAGGVTGTDAAAGIRMTGTSAMKIVTTVTSVVETS